MLIGPGYSHPIEEGGFRDPIGWSTANKIGGGKRKSGPIFPFGRSDNG